MDHNILLHIIQTQPKDAPFPKEFTVYLHKEVTNPYSQRKKNNQSQNNPTHRCSWLEECILLVRHGCGDPCSDDKPCSRLSFLVFFFPNHHSSFLVNQSAAPFNAWPLEMLSTQAPLKQQISGAKPHKSSAFCFRLLKILSCLKYAIAAYELFNPYHPRMTSQILLQFLNHLSNILLKEVIGNLEVEQLLPLMVFPFRNSFKMFKYWKAYSMRSCSIYFLHIAEWCSPK